MFSCDVPPHDEENCSTNEAELNGAGEEERCTILNKLQKAMRRQGLKVELPCEAQA